MKRTPHLRIARPCDERWEEMRPEERGRFCAACQKTVVDLSALSDREILVYLARAGQGVCGRLGMDQLERGMELEPAAPGKGRGWRRLWQWVVAGLLLSGEARAQQKTKAEDSIRYKVLPQVVVIGYGVMGRVDITGEVTTIEAKGDSTGLQERVADTLTMPGLLPKKEFTVYPNPVRKGGSASLTWQGMEPGSYQLALFNVSGAMIQQRLLEVGSAEQIDLMEIPAFLSSGVYFLRASKAGDAKVITRKIMVW